MDAGAFLARPSNFADPLSSQFTDMIAALRGPLAPPLAPLAAASPMTSSLPAAYLGGPSGYLGFPPNSLAMPSTPAPALALALAPSPAPAPAFSAPSTWNWKMILVGLIAAAIVVGIALFFVSRRKTTTTGTLAMASATTPASAPTIRSMRQEQGEQTPKQAQTHAQTQAQTLSDQVLDMMEMEQEQEQEQEQADTSGAGMTQPVYRLRAQDPLVAPPVRTWQQDPRLKQEPAETRGGGGDGVLTEEFVERYRKQHLAHFRLQGLSDEEAEQYISARLQQLQQTQAQTQAQARRLPPMPSPHPHAQRLASPAQSSLRGGFNDTIRIDMAPTSDDNSGEGQVSDRGRSGGRDRDERDANERDGSFKQYRHASITDDNDDTDSNTRSTVSRGGSRSASEGAAEEFERRRAAQDEELSRMRGGGGRPRLDNNNPNEGMQRGGERGNGRRNKTEASDDSNFTMLD